jgi:ATP-binding cassette, subfamily B, bacterial PglK
LRDFYRVLKDLFDRRTRVKLTLAALGSLVIALVDSAAIALVLPLADLATGAGTESRPVQLVSDFTGVTDLEELTIILALGIIILFVLKNLGSMTFFWWMTGFVLIERVKTSSRLLRHYLTVPYTTISQRSSAELMRTMDGAVVQVFGSTVQGLMTTVSSALSVVVLTILLLFVAPLPTMALVVYFGGAAVIYMRIVKPRATAVGALTQQASLEGYRTAFAALGAIKELKLRGTQEHFVTKYQRAQTRGARAGRLTSFLGGLPRYVLEILFITAVGIVVLVTTALPHSGTTSLAGLLTLFVAAGFRILPSIVGLLAGLSNLRVGTKALQLVHDEVLQSLTVQQLPREQGPRLPFHEELRVSDLSFRYPGAESDALRDVSLVVPFGSSVAIVGGSGAGKSTLIDALLGLHDPSAGSITVDGMAIADRKGRWQQNIGYVPQDVYLLEGTLAENVAFDQDPEDIDHDRLARAVQEARLEELVQGLPEGVHTYLGERGARLSGGQKQRVGIARALYRDCSLLVFDEATSALDNETEHQVNQAIQALRGSVTTLIVAHRLSTVRHCERIIFLKDGSITATGTFEQLLDASTEFRRLVQLGSLTPAAQKSAAESGDGPWQMS